MRLHMLEVENFKRLSSIRVELKDAGITELSGPNGSGKSSTIDAAWVLFRGLAVAPIEPIRKGAESARITGKLGDLIVTRTFKRKGDNEYSSNLTIKNPEGASYPAAQKKLDEIINTHRLDPLDFIGMSEKDQFKVMSGFVSDFDFEAADKAHKADFEARADVNRRQKEAQAGADSIRVSDKPPGTPIDEAALVEQMQAASSTNSDIERRRANRDRVASDAASLRASAAKWDERYQQLLHEAEQARVHAENDTLAAAALEKKLSEAEPLPPPVDVAKLADALNAARDTNKAIDEWAKDVNRKAELQRAAAALLAESDEITARMAERQESRNAAIRRAALPVDGIGFGEGVLLYNGVPFRQASRGEQLRVSTALSLALNPKLPLVWIRDGSLLDDESIRIVGETAAKYDGQVIIETVRATSSDAIELVDGHLKGAEDVAQKDAAA